MADNQLTIIDKINHIKHLILLGKSDHHLDEFEIELITKTAKKYGLPIMISHLFLNIPKIYHLVYLNFLRIGWLHYMIW